MVEGSGDDSNDGGRADEGAILSPNELDITDSEYVEQIDEGRFVVSPDARTSKTQQPQGGQSGGKRQGGSSPEGGHQRGGREGPTRDGSARGGQQRGTPEGSGADVTPSASRGRSRSGRQSDPTGLTEEDVRRWLRRKYEHSDAKYAFDVTAQFEGTVSQRRLASNDLITVFESLMLWYAQQVDSSMPVEEVLGILLMESNVPVRYPPESVRNLVKSTDLGPNDTIADLLEAVQDEDGVQL